VGYFSESRNVEISTFEYLKTQIDANWSNINTVKSFIQAYKTVLPVVCIRLTDIHTDRKEVGATTLRNSYTIVIDIFARSDGQRMDLAYFILDALKGVWTYNTYAQTSGAPSSLTATATDKLYVNYFNENTKLDFGEDIDKYDKYRHIISITVVKAT